VFLGVLKNLVQKSERVYTFMGNKNTPHDGSTGRDLNTCGLTCGETSYQQQDLRNTKSVLRWEKGCF